jgi:CHRD domain
MNRLAVLAMALVTCTAACGSKTPTSPSTGNQVKFTATLLPASETPAITNAENTGRGTANITFNLTKDTAGAITAVTADFTVDVNSFPAGTPITAAHIHQGASGVAGGILVSMGLGAGEIVLVNGSQTGILKTGQTNGGTFTPAQAQDMINNPQNYYFNIHSASNPGGVARGQLVKQ